MYSNQMMMALGIAALAGCVGEDARHAGAPDPIPFGHFVSEYVSAVCGQAERCRNQAHYLVEQCETEREVLLGDVASAVEADRIEYDPAAARRCVDGIAATDCMADAYSHETLNACFAALKGKVARGGECYSLFECAAGFCDSASSGQCPSTCPDTLDEGAPCALHYGPACDWRAGLRCSGGVCTQPKGVKQPCEDNSGCRSGLICTTMGEGTPRACGPLHREGGRCSSDATCAAGLYCNGDHAGGECEDRIAEGEACGQDAHTIDAALRGVQCANGLVCRGAGITQKGKPMSGQCALPAVEGEACLTEGADLQVHLSGCQMGLHCSSGTCVVPPSEGPCAQHEICQHGMAYCDSSNTCMPLKASGEACQAAEECQGGICVSSVCKDSTKVCSAP